ncbi:hypothetical protein OIU76_001506 [Salix suchowensis]|nr:hypothetical protein OIU76_001506 [Salix suchowensis]
MKATCLQRVNLRAGMIMERRGHVESSSLRGSHQEPNSINLKNDINKVERWGPVHLSPEKKAALKGIGWSPITGIKLMERETGEIEESLEAEKFRKDKPTYIGELPSLLSDRRFALCETCCSVEFV